jgi:hypothetical protein
LKHGDPHFAALAARLRAGTVTPADLDAAADALEIIDASHALVARLRDWEPDHLPEGSGLNVWQGVVDPAIERLELALKAVRTQ